MRIFQQSKVGWIDYRIAARTVKEFILSFQDRIDRRFSGMFKVRCCIVKRGAGSALLEKNPQKYPHD